MFDEYEIVPLKYIESDGRHVVVVAHQRGRGKASSATVEGEIVHVWTVEGGRTSGLWAFSALDDALEHLGWPSS